MIMLLILILSLSTALPKDHEQDHDQEQEGEGKSDYVFCRLRTIDMSRSLSASDDLAGRRLSAKASCIE